MALYQPWPGDCNLGRRVDGVQVSAPGPGCTLKGWSYPTSGPTVQFDEVNGLARVLDLAWSGMVPGDKDRWLDFARVQPWLCVCPGDMVYGMCWVVSYQRESGGCWVLSSWGLCDWEHPYLSGVWGHFEWHGDPPPGFGYVYGVVLAPGDLLDWAPDVSPPGVRLNVYNAPVGDRPISVNGRLVPLAGWLDIPWGPVPPLAVVRRA